MKQMIGKRRILGLPWLLENTHEDGHREISLFGRVLHVMGVKRMRLGVAYNLFAGEELLRASIRSIRASVDVVTVVYQDVSNLGEERESLLPYLEGLKKEGLVDNIVHYIPERARGPQWNERKKRLLGIAASRRFGCSHHMDMDVDEFYRMCELDRVKALVLTHGLDSTACSIVDYLGDPTVRLVATSGFFVPLIVRIPRRLSNLYKGDYPVLVDPTRTMRRTGKFWLFGPQVIQMHHMSLVRRDIGRKLRNSTLNNDSVSDQAKERWSNLVRSRIAFKIGHHVRPHGCDFCGTDLVCQVADEFAVGTL